MKKPQPRALLTALLLSSCLLAAHAAESSGAFQEWGNGSAVAVRVQLFAAWASLTLGVLHAIAAAALYESIRSRSHPGLLTSAMIPGLAVLPWTVSAALRCRFRFSLRCCCTRAPLLCSTLPPIPKTTGRSAAVLRGNRKMLQKGKPVLTVTETATTATYVAPVNHLAPVKVDATASTTTTTVTRSAPRHAAAAAAPGGRKTAHKQSAATYYQPGAAPMFMQPGAWAPQPMLVQQQPIMQQAPMMQPITNNVWQNSNGVWTVNQVVSQPVWSNGGWIGTPAGACPPCTCPCSQGAALSAASLLMSDEQAAPRVAAVPKPAAATTDKKPSPKTAATFVAPGPAFYPAPAQLYPAPAYLVPTGPAYYPVQPAAPTGCPPCTCNCGAAGDVGFVGPVPDKSPAGPSDPVNDPAAAPPALDAPAPVNPAPISPIPAPENPAAGPAGGNATTPQISGPTPAPEAPSAVDDWRASQPAGRAGAPAAYPATTPSTVWNGGTGTAILAAATPGAAAQAPKRQLMRVHDDVLKPTTAAAMVQPATAAAAAQQAAPKPFAAAVQRANHYRARHAAAPLSWDGALAYRAAAAVKDCPHGKTAAAAVVGETAAWGKRDAAQAVNGWYSEVGKKA